MNYSTSVYSLDGNDIYSVALKFERLGLQEMSLNSEILFQGQDTGDTNMREAIKFKATFDKLLNLFKEFHVKVIKTTNGIYDVMQADLDDEFNKLLREAKPQAIELTKSFLRTCCKIYGIF